MPYMYNGKALRTSKGWVEQDTGIQHPANWATAWTDADKAAKGVVWQDPSPQDAPFDSRFYWGRQADGTLIPRSLDDVAEVDENGDPVLDEDGVQIITKGLRTQLIEKVKTQAGGLLAPTDWMVIKASEVEGYTVPAEIITYRQAVRQASNDIENAIVACTDLDSFKALYETPVDADGNVTGNAPINDWPEAD